MRCELATMIFSKKQHPRGLINSHIVDLPLIVGLYLEVICRQTEIMDLRNVEFDLSTTYK